MTQVFIHEGISCDVFATWHVIHRMKKNMRFCLTALRAYDRR